MRQPIQHVYSPLHGQTGVLYVWFPSMHSRVDIILCHQEKPEKELQSVAGQIYDVLWQLEQMANYYHPASELYNVNQNACHHPVALSRELCHLIHLGMEHHSKTLGCFDITIQSDNYHRETHSSITLSTETSQIFYQQAGIRIDLSGLLKGYALEKARDVLQQHEVSDALVNIGNSSVLALGNHPHGEGWRVSFNNYEKGVLLCNECLTTSGNDTPERKHIVCPESGKLIEGARCLAVVTDNGTEGEILSTGLFVATPLQREVLIKQYRIKEIYDL